MLKCLFPVCIAIGLLSCAASAAGPVFPGPRPGLARAEINRDRLVLENDVLSVRWEISGGLRLVEAVDKISGQAWSVGEGECLKVVSFEPPSPNPREFRASRMRIDGPPVVRDLLVTRTTGRGADQWPGKEIVLRLTTPDGLFKVEWRASLRDESNYVRQTFLLQAADEWVELNEVTLIDLAAKSAEVRGSVDGSPVTAGNWFLGFEHPIAKSAVKADGEGVQIRCFYPFGPPLAPRQQLEYSSVIGLAPANQLRRAFMCYLERERAHPYRPFLQHNPSEDMGHVYNEVGRQPEKLRAYMDQQEAIWLKTIEDFGTELVTKRGVVMDCFVHDYLWDKVESIWLFDGSIYPDGFKNGRVAAAKYGASLGVWFTPDGVTGSRGRVVAGVEQRYEGYLVGTTYEAYTLGLSLSGPRYFARFRNSIVNMLRHHGVRFFKLDGIAEGYRDGGRPSGPGQFASDVEALMRVYEELRGLNPNIFINASTGSWPSPFWLRWADSIWHQGADVGEYGWEFEGFAAGTPRQRWITYRDSATYQNGLLRGPLYPLNSYMVHGIEFNHCSTGTGRQRVKGVESNDLIDEIRSYFASGTNLQELYVSADLMTPQTWDVLAESAKWSRANRDVLVDVHWVGGDPAKLAVYGWAAWSPGRGVLSLRNPDEKPQTIAIDIAETFELPSGAPASYRFTSPWRTSSLAQELTLTAGQKHVFELRPFEVLVLEAMPAE